MATLLRVFDIQHGIPVPVLQPKPFSVFNPNPGNRIAPRLNGLFLDRRQARGITQELDENLGYLEVKDEILKEYRKEFVSLGQLFYFYKRWGMENIVGYAGSMGDAEYILPYPDEEVVSGNRVQF